MDYEQDLADLQIAMKKGELRNRLIVIGLFTGLIAYIVLMFIGMTAIDAAVKAYYGVQ